MPSDDFDVEAELDISGALSLSTLSTDGEQDEDRISGLELMDTEFDGEPEGNEGDKKENMAAEANPAPKQTTLNREPRKMLFSAAGQQRIASHSTPAAAAQARADLVWMGPVSPSPDVLTLRQHLSVTAMELKRCRMRDGDVAAKLRALVKERNDAKQESLVASRELKDARDHVEFLRHLTAPVPDAAALDASLAVLRGHMLEASRNAEIKASTENVLLKARVKALTGTVNAVKSELDRTSKVAKEEIERINMEMSQASVLYTASQNATKSLEKRIQSQARGHEECSEELKKLLEEQKIVAADAVRGHEQAASARQALDMEVRALKEELEHTRDLNEKLTIKCEDQEAQVVQLAAEIKGIRDASASGTRVANPAIAKMPSTASAYDAELRRMQSAWRRKEQMMAAKITELRTQLAQAAAAMPAKLIADQSESKDASAQTEESVDEEVVASLAERIEKYHSHITIANEELRKSWDDRKRAAVRVAAITAASKAREDLLNREADELRKKIAAAVTPEMSELMAQEVLALKELNEHLHVARQTAEKDMEAKESERAALAFQADASKKAVEALQKELEAARREATRLAAAALQAKDAAANSQRNADELSDLRKKMEVYDEAFEDARSVFLEKEAEVKVAHEAARTLEVSLAETSLRVEELAKTEASLRKALIESNEQLKTALDAVDEADRRAEASEAAAKKLEATVERVKSALADSNSEKENLERRIRDMTDELERDIVAKEVGAGEKRRVDQMLREINTLTADLRLKESELASALDASRVAERKLEIMNADSESSKRVRRALSSLKEELQRSKGHAQSVLRSLHEALPRDDDEETADAANAAMEGASDEASPNPIWGRVCEKVQALLDRYSDTERAYRSIVSATEKRSKLEEERASAQQLLVSKKEREMTRRIEKLRMRVADLESHCAKQSASADGPTLVESSSPSRAQLEKSWRMEFRKSWDAERKKKLKDLERRFSRSFKKQLATTLKNSISSAPSPSPSKAPSSRKMKITRASFPASSAKKERVRIRVAEVAMSPPRTKRESLPDRKLSMSVSTASILDESADAISASRSYRRTPYWDLEETTPTYMLDTANPAMDTSYRSPSRDAKRRLEFSTRTEQQWKPSSGIRSINLNRPSYYDAADQDSWLCEIGANDPITSSTPVDYFY